MNSDGEIALRDARDDEVDHGQQHRLGPSMGLDEDVDLDLGARHLGRAEQHRRVLHDEVGTECGQTLHCERPQSIDGDRAPLGEQVYDLIDEPGVAGRTPRAQDGAADGDDR